jgi:hypothetical protein
MQAKSRLATSIQRDCMNGYLKKENGDGFYLVAMNATVHLKKQPKSKGSLTMAKIYTGLQDLAPATP